MKTNKEIIEEFRQQFRPEYTGGGSIKNIIVYGKKLKSVKVDLSDVESFILQALDQKERGVREEIENWLDWYVMDKHDCDKPECKVIDDLYSFIKSKQPKE